MRPALAVIELKGTETKDLDKVRDQAFNYKKNQPECVFVITSNFEKLRFYIHNAVDHEEFHLFTLDRARFELLWLLLEKENLLNRIPEKIKTESLLVEEQVTKKLYSDYSAFKQSLWQDMVSKNPEEDELLLYKKSQKLLDRFLFIFFAEDKGLLPPNSISEIAKQWDTLTHLDAYVPLYDRFKLYFGFMNTGRAGGEDKAEIHAYNGGLFAPDPLLDGLLIDDQLLKKHTFKLFEYDFDTEVDTNILDHIFEHSLNDIENVRAAIEGTAVDKSKTKRKKDGVFYTPKYIVDNTVGKLCGEKKAEVNLVDEEFAEGKKSKKKRAELKDKLDRYRNWLLDITICDPACGSGAFLNQALEFLMAEHRYLDELESLLFDSSMVLPNVENHILERNIFGVDINEESVEIARLSLWLRTAKKGRKLSSLSSNIKVGNSLIDDPEVAGDLAFNWEAEFPQVFAKGGFDVVIGNPPYVRAELLGEYLDYFSKEFKVYNPASDLFAYFYELGKN
jgi:type I restriction-modification system DNA methylase subunit